MNINPSLEVFNSNQTRVGYAPPGSAATAAARVISGLYTHTKDFSSYTMLTWSIASF